MTSILQHFQIGKKNKEENIIMNFDQKEHCGYVTVIEWLPDTEKLVSASFDSTICIWNTSTGKLLHTLGKHFSID